jgi:hypothetical protein
MRVDRIIVNQGACPSKQAHVSDLATTCSRRPWCDRDSASSWIDAGEPHMVDLLSNFLRKKSCA